MLSCGNLAHAFAAAGEDKAAIRSGRAMNIAIVTAYNDMLSAHQALWSLSRADKAFRPRGRRHRPGGWRRPGHVRRGDPGPGRHGAVAIQPRHHRPFHRRRAEPRHVRRGADAGPLRQDRTGAADRRAALWPPCRPSSSPPGRCRRVWPTRRSSASWPALHAEGKAGTDELLEAESASYHGAGTCTFYGTANSNQMMMEVMGSACSWRRFFVNPGIEAAPVSDPRGGARCQQGSAGTAATIARSAAASTRRPSS